MLSVRPNQSALITPTFARASGESLTPALLSKAGAGASKEAVAPPQPAKPVASRPSSSVTLSALRRQHDIRGTHFSDNPSPAEHILFLHGLFPSERSSVRHVGLRRLDERDELNDVGLPHQLVASKNQLATLMGTANQLAGEPNVFLTQASFVWGVRGDEDRHRCTVRYTESIGVVFVDLDVYTMPVYQELEGDAQKMTSAILAQCDKAGIPRPVLIHSGQGFYAYWALDERYVLNNDLVKMRRWQEVQGRLMTALQEFGSDHKVKDTTRVLRLVGTINGKNGKPVTVTYDDGAVHNMSELEARTRSISSTPSTTTEPQKKAPPKPPKSPTKKSASSVVSGASSIPLIPVVIPDHVPQAIDRLVAMRDLESVSANSLTPFQRRYWRAYSDIVELIRTRKGLRHGQRDEVLFWLFVTRYHSGLVSRKSLAEFSAFCAPLCDTPLDLYTEGMLDSLLARTQSRRPAKADAPFDALRHQSVKHNKGLFAKSISRPLKRLGDPNAKGAFASSAVYTPTYETLRKKLAITDEEQAKLIVLISEEKRTHRAYLASPTSARLARHAQAMEIAQREGVSAVIRDLPMSRATAYRVTQSVRTTSLAASHKSRVYRLRAQGMSLRNIANEVGVSLSTVSRWLTHYLKRERTRAVEKELLRIALSSNDSFAFTPPTSLFSSTTASISCVPLSHSDPLTIEGESKGGGERAIGVIRYRDICVCVRECVCARSEEKEIKQGLSDPLNQRLAPLGVLDEQRGEGVLEASAPDGSLPRVSFSFESHLLCDSKLGFSSVKNNCSSHNALNTLTPATPNASQWVDPLEPDDEFAGAADLEKEVLHELQEPQAQEIPLASTGGAMASTEKTPSLWDKAFDSFASTALGRLSGGSAFTDLGEIDFDDAFPSDKTFWF